MGLRWVVGCHDATMDNSNPNPFRIKYNSGKFLGVPKWLELDICIQKEKIRRHESMQARFMQCKHHSGVVVP